MVDLGVPGFGVVGVRGSGFGHRASRHRSTWRVPESWKIMSYPSSVVVEEELVVSTRSSTLSLHGTGGALGELVVGDRFTTGSGTHREHGDVGIGKHGHGTETTVGERTSVGNGNGDGERAPGTETETETGKAETGFPAGIASSTLRSSETHTETDMRTSRRHTRDTEAEQKPGSSSRCSWQRHARVHTRRTTTATSWRRTDEVEDGGRRASRGGAGPRGGGRPRRREDEVEERGRPRQRRAEDRPEKRGAGGAAWGARGRGRRRGRAWRRSTRRTPVRAGGGGGPELAVLKVRLPERRRDARRRTSGKGARAR